MGFFSSIMKVTKSIVKSPITKAVSGGLAVVFPPAGIPAAAAIATANVALGYTDTPAGKAIISAADKAVAGKKKAVVKKQLVSAAKKQLAAGVPKAQVKARLLVAARRVAPMVKPRGTPVPSAAVAAAAANRAKLAAQLNATKALAAKGDKGAQRAMAAFRLVQAARKGDPKAKAAVALVAHRWEVGQRVRSRYELTAHGRIRARV